MQQMPAEQDNRLIVKNQFSNGEPQKQMSLVSKAELFLFFSVDICNSTQLKGQKDWLEANRLLYEEGFISMDMWKFIGDEVVYWVALEKIDNLPSLIESAHHYLKQLQNELCRRFGVSFRLKGTIWMAETGRGTKAYHVKTPDVVNEFLGVEIDEGFRLSKNITGSKIVLDPKVVYILCMVDSIFHGNYKGNWFDENARFFKEARKIDPEPSRISDVKSEIRFIGYTKLKGIWNDRMYPIFWYGQEELDFEYDEQLDNTVVEPRKLDEKCISELERIFTVVGIKDKLIKILNGLAAGKYKKAYKFERTASLYYSVACVNPTSGRVLIARRSNSRVHLRGVWEFFPFKHTSTDIVQSIEKRFDEQFSLKISLVTDGEDEKNVLPLHFCRTYRYGGAHNNLLCVAFFDEGQSDDEILTALRKNARQKTHSDYAFIDSTMCKDFTALSIKEIETDSINASRDGAKVFDGNRATMYFDHTVEAVETFVRRHKEGRKWYHE